MKTKMKISVFNVPELVKDWIVIRRADDCSLWYHGQYDDRERALRVAKEVNGFISEGRIWLQKK